MHIYVFILMTYLVLTYKLYIVSNTYHTPEHYVCKWIVDGTSIEGKSGSKVFMSVGTMKTSMHLKTYLLELSRLSKKSFTATYNMHLLHLMHFSLYVLIYLFISNSNPCT